VHTQDLVKIVLAVVICAGLLIVLVTFPGIPESSPGVQEPVPGNQTQTGSPVPSHSKHMPYETHLEIFEPGTGTTYRIYPDQVGYNPLLDNLTEVFHAIRFQAKCSLPYLEFQAMKTDYLFISVVSPGSLSARYCYNNESVRCRNITSDEITVLLKKKAGNSTGTGCAETGSIFTYQNHTKGGIWSLGEENAALLEGLDRNVQDIIEHSNRVPA